MIEEEEWNTIRSLRVEGYSIIEISRRTGRDRKTVSKYLRMNEYPGKAQTALSAKTKLEPFAEFIEEQLSKGISNCVVLHEMVKEKGFQGSVSTVQRFVRPRRSQIPSVLPAPIFETEPGQEMQMDWGHFKWSDVEGKEGRLNCFVAILGWSRMRYVEFTFDMSSATLIRCHLNAFDYFGGVPARCVYDNMATVVTRKRVKGGRVLHAPFQDFADAEGFAIELSPVRWPRRKGKVERGVSYVRSNLWPQLGTVSSLEEMNHKARLWCDSANGKVHGSTYEVPLVRWNEVERALLGPIRPFVPYNLVDRTISRSCLVVYETNHYSVPHEYAGRHAKLKVANDRLEIQVDGEVVRQHDLAVGRHQRVMNDHDENELRKLVAIKLRQRGNSTQDRAPAILFKDGEEVEARDLSIYDEVDK